MRVSGCSALAFLALRRLLIRGSSAAAGPVNKKKMWPQIVDAEIRGLFTKLVYNTHHIVGIPS